MISRTLILLGKDLAQKYGEQREHNEAARISLNVFRLYLQHWMWRRQLGYILHPRIPINLEPLKIADIACGTG